MAGGALGGALEPNADDQHYWRGKAIDTGMGGATGLAGNAVANVVGQAIAPALRRTADRLVREGVELTPGQMAGGAARWMEDAMASVPVLGSFIRGAQRRSVETFNRAAYNRALADINAALPDGINSGHEALRETEGMFRNAYNQVIPNMTGVRDPAFVQDLNNIMASREAQSLPAQYQAELQHAIQTEILDRFDAGGRIAGDLAQDVGTRLDELIKPLRQGNVYQQQMGRLLREADRRFDQMMDVHNPGFAAAKERIDRGYSKFKIVQRAAGEASSLRESPEGTFTPAQLVRAVRDRDKSKDKAAFARGMAQLQDLAESARDVLPKVLPDSGTAGRMMMTGMIGGAAPFEPLSAMAAGAAALPYLEPAQRVSNAILQRAMTSAGPRRNALADMVRNAVGPTLGAALGPAGSQTISHQ